MSNYIDSLVRLLDEKNESIRFCTLEVIDLTVQQGLIPPKVTKYTLSMESDPNLEIREKAHAINIFLKERFAKTLNAEFKHAFPQTYIHLMNINEGNDLIRGTISGVSVFNGLYSFVGEFPPAEKRSLVSDVIKNIFKLFDTNQDDFALLRQVIFMIEALTYIPYKTVSEVAEMVYTLGEKLGVLGDSVREEMKVQIKNEEKDLKKLKKYIALSCALCYLIQFKNTLQVRYALNNAKMEEYSADPKSFLKKLVSPQDVVLFDFKNLPKIRQVLSNPTFDEERVTEIYEWSKTIIKGHMHDGFNVTIKQPKRGGRKKAATTKKKTTKKAPKRKAKEVSEDEYESEPEEEPTDEEVPEPELENSEPEENDEEPESEEDEPEEVKPVRRQRKKTRK